MAAIFQTTVTLILLTSAALILTAGAQAIEELEKSATESDAVQDVLNNIILLAVSSV